MKKLFVLLLSGILMIVNMLPCAAADNTEAASAQYIDILSCDTTDGWSTDGDIALDAEDHTQGEACLSFTVNAEKESDSTITLASIFDPVDVSHATVLEFDFYISDPALLRSTYIMTIDIGSAGVSTDHMLDWPSTAFDSITEAGWYHIELPFEKAIDLNFDPTAMNYFRLYFFHINPSEDLTDVVMKIDNIKAKVPPYTQVSMDTCDRLAEGDWNGNPVVRDPVNKTQGTASLKMEFMNVAQHNGWSMVCEKRYTPINVENAVYLEMDVYISGIERMHNSNYGDRGIHVEITSSGTCDWNEYCWALNDYVFKDGWTHIRLPISEAITPGAERGAPDMSAIKINYLRFHILGVRGEEPVEFSVDNVYFTVLQEQEEPFFGATPLVKQEDGSGDEDGAGDGIGDDGNAGEGNQQFPLPGMPEEGGTSGNDGTALRARQTEQRAKILLLLMIFAIIGIDFIAVALRQRNARQYAADGVQENDSLSPDEEA